MLVIVQHVMTKGESDPIPILSIPEQFRNEESLHSFAHFALSWDSEEEEPPYKVINIELEVFGLDGPDGMLDFSAAALVAYELPDREFNEEDFIETIFCSSVAIEIPGVNDGPEDEPYHAEDWGGNTRVVDVRRTKIKRRRLRFCMSVIEPNYYLPLPDAKRNLDYIRRIMEFDPDCSHNKRIHYCQVIEINFDGLTLENGRLGGCIICDVEVGADSDYADGQLEADMCGAQFFLVLDEEDTGGLDADPITLSQGTCSLIPLTPMPSA